MEEHIQDATPYQHQNDVGMNVDRSDLGVMKKLIEKGPKGKKNLMLNCSLLK